MEWLLILTLTASSNYNAGVSVTTTKLADRESCERAGKSFLYLQHHGTINKYICVKVGK